MPDAVSTMAYIGETPWHGKGARLTPGASLDVWAEEAGMGFQILRSRVQFATTREGNLEVFPDKFVLLRSDNKYPLGIVSDRFHIVQPAHVVEFFRDLVGGHGFELETMGVLFGGRRFWALARVCEGAPVKDSRDKVGLYLLLCTAADGTMATEGRFTTVRVVCNNTLQLARFLNTGIKMTHKVQFSEQDMKEGLGILQNPAEPFAETMELFRKLADTQVSRLDVPTLTASLFKPDFLELGDKARTKILASQPVATVGSKFLQGTARGSDLVGVQGTAWGWLNAVTEYVDYNARAQSDDGRLNSAWFGKGNDLKERATRMALELAS